MRLEMSFAKGTPPHPGSWVLFEAENTLFTKSTIAGIELVTPDGDPGWSLSCKNVSGNGLLVATYTGSAVLVKAK